MAAGDDTPRPISLFYSYSHKDEDSGLYLKALVSHVEYKGSQKPHESAYPIQLIQSISRSIHAERQAYVMDRKGSMPQWHPSMAFKAG